MTSVIDRANIIECRIKSAPTPSGINADPRFNEAGEYNDIEWVGSIDDARGYQIHVRSDDKENVEDLVNDLDGCSVYQTDSDDPNYYRIAVTVL